MNPMILPVFLPHLGCRERCLFCNQKATHEGSSPLFSIQKFIETSLLNFPKNKKNREKQVAFYGGSFTAINREDQIRYLREIQPFIDSGLIDSIRISTRPDALNEKILSFLKEYGVKTVEIGGQSMDDEVLSLSHRGHFAEDTTSSTYRLKRWGFEVGIHLMMGLPGDSRDLFLKSIDRVIDLRPDFVRIHPALVLRGAPLETLWKEGRYSPLSLGEVVGWLKKGILKLERASIRVARIGLQPTQKLEEDCLAGPYHPALHQLVDSAIAFDMAAHLLRTYPNGSQALLLCNPKEVSNVRGQRNENISRLKEKFELNEILVQGKDPVPRGTLILKNIEGEIAIRREELSI